MRAFTPAEAWLQHVINPDAAFLRVLHLTYGNDGGVLGDRLQLLRRALELFLGHYGNLPVRVFRSPGRINLRGMHVDTHGGYLNLVAHQRETLVVCAEAEDEQCRIANITSWYPDLSFNLGEIIQTSIRSKDWNQVLSSDRVRNRVHQRRGNWGNYVEGVVARLALKKRIEKGFYAVVASDIPSGAGLSSSHALCTAMLYALSAIFGVELSDAERILAVRDAEWYAGARSGVSDQGAMILCKNGEMVNAPLFAADLDLSCVRRLVLPEDAVVLVVNSFTSRNLSGGQMIEYTRNRFAYSLAMEIARQELVRQGVPESFADTVDRLARLSPDYLESYGGLSLLYRLLRAIPEKIAISALKSRYSFKDFDQIFDHYFGSLPENHRIVDIALRGPLLFGIAESERGRKFFDALSARDLKTAGLLMTLGHEGDRRIDSTGKPVAHDLSDHWLTGIESNRVPIERLPGSYGASSPALDSLVDCALQHGALGACLTGAGIAGSIIVLCEPRQVQRVMEGLQHFVTSKRYLAIAQRNQTDTAEIDWVHAVLVNSTIAGAGELTLNSVSK